MQRKLTPTDTARIVSEFLNSGATLRKLAEKYGTHPTTVSSLVDSFLAWYGGNGISSLIVTVDTTEDELITMPDNEFYHNTGIDKSNRWWVNWRALKQ